MSDKIGGVQEWPRNQESCGFEEIPFSRYENRGEYANARSALYAIIQATSSERIWLPDYLCETLLFPAQKLEKKVRFYAVGRKLVPEEWDWLIDVAVGDLVVVIRYFGQIGIGPEQIKKIKKSGGVVVEDMSQALFSSPSVDSDFAFYSLRKCLALPDGGVALDLRNSHSETWVYESIWNGRHVLHGLQAMAGRRRMEEGKGKFDWFSEFQRAEKAMPTGLVPMSEVTRLFLQENFNFNEILKQRRINSRYLSDELSAFRMFKEWSISDPSIGFPVLIENRDEVRNAMFAEDIYPPVHWELPKGVPESRWNRWLSSCVLTLPADHRYCLAEMERMVKVFLKIAIPV